MEEVDAAEPSGNVGAIGCDVAFRPWVGVDGEVFTCAEFRCCDHAASVLPSGVIKVEVGYLPPARRGHGPLGPHGAVGGVEDGELPGDDAGGGFEHCEVGVSLPEWEGSAQCEGDTGVVQESGVFFGGGFGSLHFHHLECALFHFCGDGDGGDSVGRESCVEAGFYVLPVAVIAVDVESQD